MSIQTKRLKSVEKSICGVKVFQPTQKSMEGCAERALTKFFSFSLKLLNFSIDR